MSIRVSMGHVERLDETVIAFARQLGLRGVQLHAPADLPGEQGYWTTAELRALRECCERAGLAVDGLENVPHSHFTKIQRGESGRDEQIENFQATIRNMADAGILLLGYNLLATYVWPTDMACSGRGGATVTAFDLARAGAGNALAGYKLTPGDAAAWDDISSAAYCSRGRSHAIGYLQGMLRALGTGE
jgi:mannonate dehydratase